jgi:hypothetical protein
MSIHLRVISLGAGVQSTTMALMAAHGELTPTPDFAVFADTGNEPAAVYEHLKWLRGGNVIMCPYRSDEGWREMRDKTPAEFEQACQIDEAVRAKWPGTTGDVFVHRSMKPLRQADLSTHAERGQPDLFRGV